MKYRLLGGLALSRRRTSLAVRVTLLGVASQIRTARGFGHSLESR